MSYAALGYLRQQYLCVLRRCAWFNAGMLSAGLMALPGVSAHAAGIVADGRTQTQVMVNGAITDITTQTMRGANAFNSFSKFNVETANTVNLHLPGQTSNLLNLVHDETSYINGLVNAYKGGKIGGNVFFFNPHGIVVGAGGVLNVGSLTLATPTPAYMDRLLSPAGVIDDAATAEALAGHIPLSQTGLVLVKGRINAADAVTLAGGNVDVAPGAQVFAGGRAQVAFADLVNVDGMAVAADVKMDGGVIRIVAAEDITVAGQVSADGVGDHANGGSVTVMAEGNATLASTGRASADAGTTGDGGFVEFSAKHDVNLDGNGLSAKANQGRAGHILIDPENLTWTGSGDDYYSHGAKITITADKKVTLDNVVVSSRNIGAAADTRSNHQTLASQGDSGDIEVTAKDIEIKNGSQLLANADNGHAAGKITIAATDNQSTPAFGSLEDSIAKISIKNAVIKGGDVSIKAVANDKWVWTGNEYADTVLDFLGSLRVGANVTFSTAHATVEVDDGAQIDAKGSLDIESHATADASMKVMSTLVGFGYGETDSQAKVTIGNATLGSDAAMTLKSQADSTLSVNVDTVNTGSFNNLASSASKYANFAFAVGIGNQSAETTVTSAATISRASSLDVEATGEKSHGVAASGGSFKDGVAAAGISVLITDTTMTASLGGNVTAGKVTVKAALADDASTEISAAAGTAGSPDLQEAITSARPVDEILFEKLSDFVAAAPDTDSRSGSSGKLGLSAAFAWVDSTTDVKAEVAGGARVTTPGSLDVVANATESLNFETSAAVDQRDLDTQLPDDTQTAEDKKKVAISASVLVAKVKHHADALIGDNAVISAGGPVTVRADAILSPFWQQWVDLVDEFKNMKWKDADAWVKLGSAVYDVLGDPINATTWTQTAVESEKLGFAGAVDFFTVDQKATAKIGNASINASSVNPTADQDVNVIATASQGTLNLVGVPEFDPTSAPGSNSSSGSAGFGGSYLQYNLSGGTDASIASGANVRADDVVVLADTNFDQINVAESVGKAAKVSINGAFSLVDTDVHTIAQIGAGGSMTANDVLVKAADDSLVINVGGGVGRSQSVGVGLSVAINELDREVRAIVGNRAGETATGGTMTLSGNLLVDAHAGSTQGAFTVAGSGPSGQEKDDAKGGDGKKSNAKDGGQQGKSGVGISGAAAVNLINDTTAATIADLNTITVSGSAASSVAVDKDGDGTADETVNLAKGLTEKAKNDALVLAGAGSLTVAQDKSAGLAGAFTWNELVKDTRATLSDATVTVHNGAVNLDADNTGAMWSISAGGAVAGKVGIAGSVSYSTIDNVTEAAIDNADVDADSTVVLDAKDDSDIRSVAGAVSYGGKAGIGAAVSINTVDSDTTARISGAGKTVGGDAGVSATATNDNSIVAVAAALGASQGVAVSGSVTWNVISNNTEASLNGATVTSSGNAVNLDADDTADILAISGSVALSTNQASVGIAGSYNEIDNETYARATGGSLSGTGVRLEATENADIQAIAVAGSGSAKAGVTGSLGVNTIGNITQASTSATTVNTAGDATVRAKDTSKIQSITGAAAVGGNGAVGASGSYNHIGSTVTAKISGGTVDAANVLVDAERSATLDVWAISGSGGGTAGFAGSIALNDIGGVTTAAIDGGADVEASGNALVTAQADDQISSQAGGLAFGGSFGGAGAIAFNDVHSDTLAQVAGTNTRVTALGNGGVAQVDNGSLTAFDSSKLPSQQTLSTRQLKDNVRGAAVVASSTSQVQNFAVSAGGGGSTGVAGTVSVAMMTGYTSAEVVDGASLNAGFGGGEQEARVAAYHHDYLGSGTGGVGVGADAGAGGAMDTLIASHVTTAEVRDATVQGRKAVRVDAGSSTEIAQAVIGLGGGTYAGLSGSIGLILQEGKTQALVDNGDLNSKGDLTVEATSEMNADIFAGAVSLSGVAGFGLTGIVSVYDQTTQAIVGDGSNLNANATTRVKAKNDVDQDVIAGTASAAGGVGVAGTVNVAVIKGNTLAVVGAKSDAGQAASHVNADAAYGGAGQDVIVEAKDTTRVDDYLGGLGIGLGGAGVGAAVDVVMVNNGASAEVRSGSVTADRDITVQANTERMLDSFTIAAAGGSTTGISGAVSVLTAGSRPDDDAEGESGSSLGEVARYVSANAFGNQMDSDAGGTSASRDRANAARARANVSNDMNAPAADYSAKAYAAAGTTLTAGRDATVSAHNATDTDAIAVGVAVSGGFSLGGGVALSFVDDKTEAEADGIIRADRNVTVSAGDGQLTDTQGLVLDVGDIHINQRTAASKLLTFAGGGGVVGLGASVAIQDKTSKANAKVGAGADLTANGTAAAEPGGVTGLITVDAGIQHDLESTAFGAAVGLGGIGAAIAYTTLDGEANALVGNGAHLTGKAMDVHGHSKTDSDVSATAAAGGLFSGAGADADAEDKSSAKARIGDNAVIRTGTGLAQVRADVDPVAKAQALGVAVSASVSIGVSLADATVETRAEAGTGTGTDVKAGALTVQAETRLRGKTAESDATAGAGGLLLGAGASDANSVVRTDTVAEVGSGNKIDVTDEFKVKADSDTYADADVTGINVGLLAGGSNNAKARTDTETYATVGDNPTIKAHTVKVDADSNDTLRANTVAGAGGLGVLVASKAETDADAHTHARLGGPTGTGGTIDAVLVEVGAAQHVNFNARADSTSASAIGYSGARAVNHVDTDTRAILGPMVTVNAEDFSAQAWNDILKPELASGYNVDSGSGGLLNAAAARSESFIRNSALVEIQDGAKVDVEVAGITPVGALDLAAWNQVEAHDVVRLDSGGAIAIAKAESEIRNDKNDAIVRVGPNATLLSDGDINLSTRTESELHSAARSKTYGLAGAAEGESASLIKADNRVELLAGAKVEAWGDLHLMAGTDRAEGNDLYADAETRLWNYTALPVETDPDADGTIIQHNTIDIAAGAQARAVKSVYLTATEGDHRTRGFGEGTDAYRETLSAIGEFFGADTSSLKITGGSTYDNANALGGLDPSSGVNVDGEVHAGIHHLQYLTLDSDGLTVLKQSDGVTFYLENGVSLADLLQAEIQALKAKKEALQKAAADYASTSADATSAADAAAGIGGDINVLEAQLAAIGGGVKVDFVHVNPITALTGDVRVTGRYLIGDNGVLDAPGDVRIDIVNRSTRFMTTSTLTIPDGQGGQVTFNGLGVSSTAEINQRNAIGRTASNMTVLNADTSPKPVIDVRNTNGNDSPTGQPAQLWMLGDVTNLRGEANANSQGTLRVSANIDAETVNIATGGDFIKTYTPGFTHQGGNPISRLGSLPDDRQNYANTVGSIPNPIRTDGSASSLGDYDSDSADPGCASVACGTTIAGNNVYISAEKLNINGVIQAGLPDRAMTIDAALLNAVNPDAAVHGQNTKNSAAISSLRAKWLSGDHSQQFLSLNEPAAGSSAIRVSYDAANDRLQLDNVRMGGGHMELFGNIFSTGNGELRVMDGYGRINVSNSTAYDLAVGRVDTGAGVEGVIKITDTAKRIVNGVLDVSGNATGGKPLVTQITRLGDTVYTHDNQTADGSVTHQVSSIGGRVSSYAPVTNRRFNWINGRKTFNKVTDVYETNSLRLLTDCDWCEADSNPDPVHTAVTTTTQRLTGDWLSTGESASLKDYEFDYTRYTSPVVRTDDYHEVTESAITSPGVTWGYHVKDKHTTVDQWTVYEYYQHSLDASKTVNVTFTGYDTANVNVNAGTGKLLLGGLVRGLTGDTTLNGGAGIEALNGDARVVAGNLTLTSANGAIGSAANPIQIDLTDADPAKGLADGKVTATAPLGVALKEISGDLRAATIRASNGDVRLTADRNLRGTTNGTTVTGNNLNLVSISGEIGSDAAPLIVDTQGNATTLTADAAGNIHLREATGDLRVVQVRSEAGDVRLSVPNGSLLDANSAEVVDESTRDQLLALWDEMRLTGAKAEQARDQGLQAQEGRLKQEYETYFQMRNLRRQADGGYVADAYDPGFAYHATGVQAAALKTANGWSDADLAAYETEQTAAYHAAAQRFGAGAYVVGFKPALSDSETAALSDGAVWSDAQLSNALAAGLFRSVSDTEVRIEDANVIGRHLTLEVGKDVGLVKTTPVVIRRGTSPAALSPEEKLALLTAERGDIEIVGDELRIRQLEDVDVTASGQVKASAPGDILLGSESNLLIDQIDALGEVRIKTAASLSGVAGKTHVSAARAILEAGGGDLGSAATPIAVDLRDAGILTARAGQDLFVRELTGDMTVESIFAKGDVHLRAQGSIVEASADTALDVRGDNVSLEAGDTIGKPGGDNALDVAVDALGRLDAMAPNGIYLNSTGANGQLGNISTGGGFRMTVAAGGMTVVGLVQAGQEVVLGAADDLEFAGGGIVAGGPVTVEAGRDGTGSLLIGQPTGGGDAIHAGGPLRLGAADDVVIGAGVRGDGDAEVAAGFDVAVRGGTLEVAGRADVSAGGGIEFIAGTLIASGDAGLASLNGDLTGDAASLLRVGGDLDAVSGRNLSLIGTTQVGANLRAQAGVDLRLAGETTVGGELNLAAGRDASLDGVTGVTGALVLQAGRDSSTDGQIAVGGSADLGAGNDMRMAGNVGIAGALGARAGNDVAVTGDVSVTGAVALEAGRDAAIGGQLATQSDAALVAGRDIRFTGGLLAARGDARVAAGGAGAGSVRGDTAPGPDLRVTGHVDVSAPDAIGAAGAPLEIATDGEVDLQGTRVFVAMNPIAAGKEVVFRIKGSRQDLADEVGLDVVGAGDVVMQSLRAVLANIATDGDNLSVLAGHAGDFATFRTPFFLARIDHINRNPTPGFDVRGFTLTGDYTLGLQPNEAHIGAYVINQDPNRIVYSNPGGNADQENGDSLRSQQSQSNVPNIAGLLNGAPASGELVSVDPDLLNEEDLLDE